MNDKPSDLPILVAGGGIGGLAAALALVRRGFAVKVMEQAPQIGEIGAGIQLGPNAFAAFDALGIGEKARSRAVYTDEMVMHDALDETLVGRIPTGEAFRQRFGNPYAVIHRADVHGALFEGAQESGRIKVLTSTHVSRIEQDAGSVTAFDQHGVAHRGSVLIGADGVKSVVRQQYVGDAARVSGHVVYRAVVDKKNFPADLQWNAASIWVGPNCHLVHYPLRGGEQYNVVVTFHSRNPEEWSVKEGSREEVQSYFEGICPRARQLPRPTASRSASGLSAALPCWAMPRTRRCSTWRKAPAWRWKTRSRWAKRCASTATTLPRPSSCTSAHALPAPRALCCRRARWAGFSMPRASSAWCATTCGKAARPSAFMTRWSGSTVGTWATAWPLDPFALLMSGELLMQELGRLEDLPVDYREALTRQNLVPLWPSLRAVLPAGKPQPRTRATAWSYQAIRPLLLQAGELTPIEKAERRVLVLANPGHGLEKMQASAAMYLGMQLLLPGEWAPAHRHTPNAVRMIVEGEGAYTTVNGEKCPMRRGDLILTPTGLWHEHGHDGSEPVVWLDVLDLPLVYYMEASYHVDGPRQAVTPGRGDRVYAGGGMAPTPMFERSGKAYPMLRYPWVDARAALETMAADQPALEAVQLSYVNPETGADAENILGFYALMLRAGQSLRLPVRSPAMVFHVIEGGVEAAVEDQSFTLLEADTCCAPGYKRGELAQPQQRQARVHLYRRRVAAAPQARRI
jgi:gentisate 1,2-dioxygenase